MTWLTRREEASRRVAHTQAQIEQIIAMDMTVVEMRDLLVFLCGNDPDAVQTGLKVIAAERAYRERHRLAEQDKP